MIAKPKPRLLEKRERRASVRNEDRAENQLVKARSGGQCELIVGRARCGRRAAHVHHLISGIGRRNLAPGSICHTAKLHLCECCHAEIHGHVLVPINQVDRYDAAKIRFERVR